MEAAAACAAPMGAIPATLSVKKVSYANVTLLWEQVPASESSWLAFTTVSVFQLHELPTGLPKNDLVSEAHY